MRRWFPRLRRSFAARLPFCAALCVVLLLGACAAPPPSPLRIGINPWPGYSFAYLARDWGYFEQAGAPVTLVEFSSLADMRRAFERGQLDGFFGTPLEALLARARSPHRPRIALVADYSRGGDRIVASADIRTLAALRNRRIALEPDSINLYVLVEGLASAGLALADVELVAIPQTHLANAFAARKIDAAVTYAPFSHDIAARHAARNLYDSAALPTGIQNVLILDQHVDDTRSRDVAAFRRAYWRAVAAAARDPRRAFGVLGRYLGVGADEVARQLREDVRLVGADEQPAEFAAGGPLLTTLQRMTLALIEVGEPGARFSADMLAQIVGTLPAVSDAAR